MNKLFTAAFLVSLVATVSAEAAAPKAQRQNLGLKPLPTDPISGDLNSIVGTANSFLQSGESTIANIENNTQSLTANIEKDDGNAQWSAFLTAAQNDMQTWQTSACDCLVLKNCDPTNFATLQTFTGTPKQTGTDSNGQPMCSFTTSQTAGGAGYMAYAISQLPSDGSTIGKVAEWANQSAAKFGSVADSSTPLGALAADFQDLITYNNQVQAVITNWAAADNARKNL